MLISRFTNWYNLFKSERLEFCDAVLRPHEHECTTFDLTRYEIFKIMSVHCTVFAHWERRIKQFFQRNPTQHLYASNGLVLSCHYIEDLYEYYVDCVIKNELLNDPDYSIRGYIASNDLYFELNKTKSIVLYSDKNMNGESYLTFTLTDLLREFIRIENGENILCRKWINFYVDVIGSRLNSFF